MIYFRRKKKQDLNSVGWNIYVEWSTLKTIDGFKFVATTWSHSLRCCPLCQLIRTASSITQGYSLCNTFFSPTIVGYRRVTRPMKEVCLSSSRFTCSQRHFQDYKFRACSIILCLFHVLGFIFFFSFVFHSVSYFHWCTHNVWHRVFNEIFNFFSN